MGAGIGLTMLAKKITVALSELLNPISAFQERKSLDHSSNKEGKQGFVPVQLKLVKKEVSKDSHEDPQNTPKDTISSSGKQSVPAMFFQILNKITESNETLMKSKGRNSYLSSASKTTRAKKFRKGVMLDHEK